MIENQNLEPKPVPLTDNQLAAIYRATEGTQAVLVGGQAVAVWVELYDLPNPYLNQEESPLTFDADILADKNVAKLISRSVGGTVAEPVKEAITALVAIISIEDKIRNQVATVDVIHRVAGLDKDKVMKEASTVNYNGRQLKIINPFHLLQSKLYNLSNLIKKNTPEAVAQTKLAIDILRESIEGVAHQNSLPERKRITLINKAIDIASSTNGQKAFKNHQLDFLKLLPEFTKSIKNKDFQEKSLVHFKEKFKLQKNDFQDSSDMSMDDSFGS